jgi:hypothetical protein
MVKEGKKKRVVYYRVKIVAENRAIITTTNSLSTEFYNSSGIFTPQGERLVISTFEDYEEG